MLLIRLSRHFAGPAPKTTLALLAFAICMHSARDAHAGPAEMALLREGVALRKKGDDAGALKVFLEADAAAPTSETHAQVGLAHQALEHWVQAESALMASLATPTDPFTKQYQTTLEGALHEVRDHLGTLEVTCSSPCRHVTIDGIEQQGVISRSVLLRATVGRHKVEHATEQFARGVYVTDLKAGETAKVNFVLQPVAYDLGPPQQPKWHMPVAITLFGTSAALVGLSVLFGRLRESTISDMTSHVGQCNGMLTGSDLSFCTEKKSTAQAQTTWSAATGIAGGAVGIAGVILLLTAPSSQASSKQAGIRLSPASNGLRLDGTF